GSVTITRLFVLFCCMIFGMFGFFISMIAVLVYLASLRSLGVPYLAPLAPITWAKVKYLFLRLPSNSSLSPYASLHKRKGRGEQPMRTWLAPKAALLLAMTLSTTACWDETMIQDVHYLTAIGFSYDEEEKQYKAYGHIIDLSAVAKKEEGSGGEQGSTTS